MAAAMPLFAEMLLDKSFQQSCLISMKGVLCGALRMTLVQMRI